MAKWAGKSLASDANSYSAIPLSTAFFAPKMGIKEDPVTGSAHALVAPWWCKKLSINQVQGWQPSQRPGGMLCEPLAAAKVRIKGNGVILWQGYLPWQSSTIESESWIFTSC
ncbi:MAG: hypothetical protein EBQ52_06395 [Synechococcaceae bacterium LLD_019]|nr:hypothetical protein [Synechococcaceae bacterium LLD_019]